MKKYLYLLIAAGLWFHFYHIGETNPIGAGVTSPSMPYQGETAQKPVAIDSFEIHPKAGFEAEVRVLAAEHYYFDRKAWLSPMDIVVGWGNLSDESIYQGIEFDQFDRSYSWTNHTTLDNEEIRRSTANINIIPADNFVEDQLDNLKIGQVIHIRGSLVDVERTMHWKWKTSLSREDQGEKASEILYLTEIEILGPSL